jgi:hypothetical protein
MRLASSQLHSPMQLRAKRMESRVLNQIVVCTANWLVGARIVVEADGAFTSGRKVNAKSAAAAAYVST